MEEEKRLLYGLSLDRLSYLMVGREVPFVTTSCWVRGRGPEGYGTEWFGI